jgi:hypothetical protein
MMVSTRCAKFGQAKYDFEKLVEWCEDKMHS